MCTQFCVCPYSGSKDKHYLDYSQISQETYSEYNRSFIPPLDDMVVQIYESVFQSQNITEPENPLIF